jgi:hypothetical protein
MKKLHGLLAIIGLAVALAFTSTGCGKRTLAPDGAYKGNMGLYVQDDAISTANSGLHQFLTWEYQNRLLVPVEVSQFADKVRNNRFQWNQTALRLRDAYALSPTDANQSAFKAALNELQQALIEATVIMAKQKGTK